jgi:hypothetical protein
VSSLSGTDITTRGPFIAWPSVEELVGQRGFVYRNLIFINVELEQGPAGYIYRPLCHARQGRKLAHSLRKTSQSLPRECDARL